MPTRRTRSDDIATERRIAALREYMREERLRQGLTQYELADIMDVPQSYISELERGRTRSPSLHTLDRWCCALGVPFTVGSVEYTPTEGRVTREDTVV